MLSNHLCEANPTSRGTGQVRAHNYCSHVDAVKLQLLALSNGVHSDEMRLPSCPEVLHLISLINRFGNGTTFTRAPRTSKPWGLTPEVKFLSSHEPFMKLPGHCPGSRRGS